MAKTALSGCICSGGAWKKLGRNLIRESGIFCSTCVNHKSHLISGASIMWFIDWRCMVGVAQLVRAPGCGPGGRRFKSGHSPSLKFSGCSAARLAHLLWEQGVGGSNPLTPTSLFSDESPCFTTGAFYFYN